MVELDAPGLRMEESYYAGTINSGTQYGVDFSVIAETAGELKGNVIVSYEDEYGDATVKELPIYIMAEEYVEPYLTAINFRTVRKWSRAVWLPG
jgi:hypothetical protein